MNSHYHSAYLVPTPHEVQELPLFTRLVSTSCVSSWHHLISEYQTYTPPEDEPISHPDLLQHLRHISIKLRHPGNFEESDIDRNKICDADLLRPPRLPDFVTAFEQGLVRKPHLRPDVLFPRFVRLRSNFDGSA